MYSSLSWIGIKAIQDTGLADKIILEEYEGQKVDDVKKYQVDVFAIGSDWYGDFDYLKEYCEVVYLERTKGISSTQIREKQQFIKLGIIGQGTMVDKLIEESRVRQRDHGAGCLRYQRYGIHGNADGILRCHVYSGRTIKTLSDHQKSVGKELSCNL